MDSRPFGVLLPDYCVSVQGLLAPVRRPAARIDELPWPSVEADDVLLAAVMIVSDEEVAGRG